MPSWSFFATTLDGAGGETLLVADLPLTGAEVTLALSGADAITGKIDPELPELINSAGQPKLVPWQTAVYAEQDGVIRAGGIIKALKPQGSSLTLDVIGFSGYPDQMPWTAPAKRLYDQDPADVFRMIWTHVQSQSRGNLGLVVSPDVKTGTKVGTKTYEEFKQPTPTTATKTTAYSDRTVKVTTHKKLTYATDSNTTVTTVTTVTDWKQAGKATTSERRVTTVVTRLNRTRTTTTETYNTAGTRTSRQVVESTIPSTTKVKVMERKVASDEPFVLADYETHDLKQKLTELAEAGPFDWREMHTWTQGRQAIAHELRLGAPRIGRRRTDQGLSIGVNVDPPDGALDVDDYASEVLVVGAGEGDKMVRSRATNTDARRLRRVKVIQAKGIGRKTTADAAAARYAQRANSFAQDVEELIVHDHPMSPLEQLEPGDELYLEGDAGWLGTIGQWVRILSVSFSPSQEPYATLSVARADKAW